MIVKPSFFNVFTISQNLIRVEVSIPAVGSSKNRILGFPINESTNERSLLCPPESFEAKVSFSLLSNLNKLSISSSDR